MHTFLIYVVVMFCGAFLGAISPWKVNEPPFWFVVIPLSAFQGWLWGYLFL